MDYPGKVITKTQVTPTQTSASGNWTLDDQAAAIKNNNWPVALVPNPISKSLRFNSADTAYLSRVMNASSTTYTVSCWVKRGLLSGYKYIFASGPNTASDDKGIAFDTSTNKIYAYNGSTQALSTAVFRDPSAWYHVVMSVNSGTASIYVNNVNTNVSQTSMSLGTYGRIGRFNDPTPANDFDGYMTEFYLIDGQALTPSSFGMTNPQTGQWIPLKYSGTYGTNGFYLNFKDATSTTTLGYDYSGNANNWTANNFSVTAGAGNDSLTDVPTPWFAYNTTGDVGGVIRGNYCTWSPLAKPAASSTSNGNLTAVTTTAADERIFSTIAVSSGKWYWEVTPTAISSGGCMVAVTSSAYEYKTANLASGDDGYGYYTTGNKYNPSTATAYGNTFTTNDVIGVALDMDNGKIYFSKNGTFQNSGDPVAGTNAAFTSISGTYTPSVSNGGTGSSCTVEANFGQRPFAYTPPTGFRSLCTTNLPATTIGFGLTNQADDYFNTIIWTGNSSSASTTRTQTGVGFQPDFVWIKNRSNAYFHNLYDSVRGSGSTKNLISNGTYTEGDSGYAALYGYLSAFTSDGFQTTNGTDANPGIWVNQNGENFVAWNWKASGSTVSNTAGTITSTVSANTTAGFSVVTYTGTGSNATVGHGLGVAPAMYIVKRRTGGVGNWAVWHIGLSNTTTSYILLDSTAGQSTSTSLWGSTAATSTTLGLGTSVTTNNSSNTYVAYCFAAVAGYSAFGSYTGNGSTDGPFVYLGFRPRWVMSKSSSNTNSWVIYDAVRETYNVMGKSLYANLSDAEIDSPPRIDFLSNGFKLRAIGEPNNSGYTFVYAAFAESPFQFANAR